MTKNDKYIEVITFVYNLLCQTIYLPQFIKRSYYVTSLSMVLRQSILIFCKHFKLDMNNYTI